MYTHERHLTKKLRQSKASEDQGQMSGHDETLNIYNQTIRKYP